MDDTIKVRLREKDKQENSWRYALTISNDGIIMSSTKDVERAGAFPAELLGPIQYQKTKPLGVYRNTDVEVF
jgi:hypothetical protein